MANRYVRSTDGNDSDNASTWLLAKATLKGGANGDSAGDTVYVSHVHSETTAATTFFAWAGSASNPVKVICVNDNNEPPTVVASTAIVEVTGAGSEIEAAGSHYCYGITFRNNGTGDAKIWLHNNLDQIQLWDNCNFEVNSATGSALYLNSQSTTTGFVKWRNVDLLLAAASSVIIPQCDKWIWEGGSMLTGSGTTALFTLSTGRNVEINIRGVDFSHLPANFYFIGTNGGCRMIIQNCKLPAAWTGGIYNGILDFAARVEMYNCDSGDTNYKFQIQDQAGDITQSTAIYRVGGASDGFTYYSMAMTSNANCNIWYDGLSSPEISIWNDIVASPITLNIDFCHDSLTDLNNDEVRLQVEYLGDTTTPLSTLTHSGLQLPLDAATAVPASTNSWLTTGLANSNAQTLSVTVTPQQRGYLHCRVILTKASYPIYIDPKIEVT